MGGLRELYPPSIRDYDWTVSRTRNSVDKSCGGTARDARDAVQGRILRFTINNIEASPETIPSRTSSRFTRRVTHGCIARERFMKS